MAKFNSFFTPKRTDLIISCAGGDDADPFIREAEKTNVTGEYKCGCHYEKKIKKMFLFAIEFAVRFQRSTPVSFTRSYGL
jgi:hypothetical protein